MFIEVLILCLPCSLTSMASFGASHHIAHVGREKITPKPGYRTWLVSSWKQFTVKTLLHFLQDSNTTCFKEISVNRATKGFFFSWEEEKRRKRLLSKLALFYLDCAFFFLCGGARFVLSSCNFELDFMNCEFHWWCLHKHTYCNMITYISLPLECC